jgi:hypothetical protein
MVQLVTFRVEGRKKVHVSSECICEGEGEGTRSEGEASVVFRNSNIQDLMTAQCTTFTNCDKLKSLEFSLGLQLFMVFFFTKTENNIVTPRNILAW